MPVLSKPLPSQEYLNECFDYNPDTGVLTWKRRNRDAFVSQRGYMSWNARYAGKPAGRLGLNPDGGQKCIDVCINSVFYKAHRIVWVMSYGHIDDSIQVDHIDGNPWNNKLSNLRLATNTQNQWNKGTYSHNTSGHPGVSYDQSRNKYMSYLEHNGRRIHTARWDTKPEAIVARAIAEVIHLGEFRPSVRVTKEQAIHG